MKRIFKISLNVAVINAAVLSIGYGFGVLLFNNLNWFIVEVKNLRIGTQLVYGLLFLLMQYLVINSIVKQYK